MKGKVVPLKPRAEAPSRNQDSEPWKFIVDFLQPQVGEMEQCLQQEITRAPELIRDTLVSLSQSGERYCPALFLAIAKPGAAEQNKMPRLAASLEALSLALKVHRMIEAKPGRAKLSATEAILAGDFFFSLALTMAGEIPVFIKGMSEIISRVVSSEINKPTRHVYFQAWRKACLQRISDGYASLMALASTLGAWFAGKELWQNEALSYFGHYLGMGLQLRREQVLFERSLKEKDAVPEVTLPLVYILEQSPRQHDLLALLNRSRLTVKERAVILKERDRVNPKPYMEKVSRNCFVKANEFLELVRENIEPEKLTVLKSFMQLEGGLV